MPGFSNRTTRRISLTEIGAAYYERARAALDTLAEAEQAVVDLSAAPSGVLRVSIPSIFGNIHVAPILPAFALRYPEIRLDVAINDRFVDLVQEGLDVAVRVAELRDSSLVARRIAPFRRLVCASPAYVARHGRPNTPEELAEHDCLVLTSYQPRGAIGSSAPARRSARCGSAAASNRTAPMCFARQRWRGSGWCSFRPTS